MADRGAHVEARAPRPPAGAAVGPGSPVPSSLDPRELPRAALASVPEVVTPTGGGAIRGISEKFAVTAATGTGGFTVAVRVPPGRGAVQPSFALEYDSGLGNGPFGLGWRLDVPMITRKLSDGVPRYDDVHESDTFLLAGAEDLVPLTDAAGVPVRTPRTLHGVDHLVQRYRPRVEADHARIERWQRVDDGTSHWRTTSRDGVTTVYGETPASRVADPRRPHRCACWLADRVHDDRGNVMVYEHVAEDGAGVDLAAAHEAGRAPEDRTAQRYLRRVLWVGATPYHPDLTPDGEPTPLPTQWAFELVLDYGDLDATGPERVRAWPVRADPFSTYREGFEVRTYRRCERLLVRHHAVVDGVVLDPQVGPDALVRAVELGHRTSGAFSVLGTVTEAGFVREGGGYRRVALPPLELTYSAPADAPRPEAVAPEALGGLPAGLAGVQLVDLDGDGLPGALSDDGTRWTYRPNLGPAGGPADPRHAAVARPGDAVPPPVVRLGAPTPVPVRPSASTTGAAGAQLVDLDGDGRLDLVRLDGPLPGFHARAEDGGWLPFRAFGSRPGVDLDRPGTRLVDTTGDGLVDVLVADDAGTTVWPSLGARGFGAPTRATRAHDDDGPAAVHEDGTGTLLAADMTGDGLLDLVRVRPGRVEYWPALGHGRYGARVRMDDAPALEGPASFDPRRVHLVDVDGSGPADLVYVGATATWVHANHGGNAWGPARRLPALPPTTDPADVRVADLLGTGLPGLVWSSAAPSSARRPLRWLDLLGRVKPHLLVGVANGTGTHTTVTYAPSTAFLLRDRAAGRPWLTTLPFPVHVVERVDVLDRVTGARAVTRYAYHHGTYDGVEREFRGFACVDQWDTEEVLDGGPAGVPGTASNWDAASWAPPVHVRTWFHVGLEGARGDLLERLAREYWAEEPDAEDGPTPRTWTTPLTLLDPDLDPAERRDAVRAAKGTVLRVETYADDGDGTPGGEARALVPFTVTEASAAVRRVVPRRGTRPAVLAVQHRETVHAAYERDPDDPRVTQDLTLEVGPFGEVRREAQVTYPRRPGRLADEPGLVGVPLETVLREQARTTVVVTEHAVTEPVADGDVYRGPAPAGRTVVELRGLVPVAAGARRGTARTPRLTLDDVASAWTALVGRPGADTWSAPGDLAPHVVPADELGGTALPVVPHRRLLGRSTLRYRTDDLAGLLPPGSQGRRALPGEEYVLATTDDQLAATLGDLVDPATLADAGYVRLPAEPGWAGDWAARCWWAPGGRTSFALDRDAAPAAELAAAVAGFFEPVAATDPFGGRRTVERDAWHLLPVRSTDAVGNASTSTVDYRVLAPRSTTDANSNRTEALHDALGAVVAIAVRGPVGTTVGDRLDGVVADLSPAVLEADARDPLAADPGVVGSGPAALLGDASVRVVHDLWAYARTHDDEHPQPVRVHTLTRTRTRSDDPSAPVRHAVDHLDGAGRTVQTRALVAPGPLEEGAPTSDPRWLVSAWTTYDNVGEPVRTYEPSFAATSGYARVVHGRCTVRLRDAGRREVGVLRPDATWDKRVLGAWRLEAWDAGDTVAVADPRTDPHLGDRVRRLLDGDDPPVDVPFVSWHDRRAGGLVGEDDVARAAEQAAAAASSAYAGTPRVDHLDASGRVVASLGHDGDHVVVDRTVLDVRGRHLRAVDALGRTAGAWVVPGPAGTTVSGTDLLGTPLVAVTMDGGTRRELTDVTGRTVLRRDDLGRTTVLTYDAARRPVAHVVRDADGERVVGLTVYGEGRTAENLAGRVWRSYDTAGLVVADRYDHAGNAVAERRALVADAHALPDWTAVAGVAPPDDPADDAARAAHEAALDAAGAPGLEPPYRTLRRHDALHRELQVVTAHRPAVPATGDRPALPATRPCVVRTHYDQGGHVVAGDVWLHRDDPPEDLLDPATADLRPLAGVDVDAHGRTVRLERGNGTVTTFAYDDESGRVTRAVTVRPHPDAGRRVVQDLRYTYDAVGNPTTVRDEADPHGVVFFDNVRVDATRTYAYDALYRLVAATGREHVGQTAGGQHAPPRQPRDTDAPRTGHVQPGDGLAMTTWRETYEHDDVGRLLHVHHVTPRGEWHRRASFAEASRVDPAETGNRLSSSSAPGDPAEGPWTDTFAYDAHGATTRMPHLEVVDWDELGRLRGTSRQRVLAGTPETTWYTYDAAGARVRKVTDAAADAGATPRRRSEHVVLGALEIHRSLDGAGLVERHTLALEGAGRVVVVQVRVAGVDDGPERLDRYPCTDHQGSVGLELDADAGVVSYEEFHPYGSSAYRGVRALTDVPARFGWCGSERDGESGLVLLGARYYAPWLARFLSPDPAGLADGTDVYAYARGNPVSVADPSGTEGEQLWFSQSAPYHQTFNATRSGRGIREWQRENFRKAIDVWGGPEAWDVGHTGKPHVLTRAGEEWTGMIEEDSVNRSKAAGEAAMGEQARAQGDFARDKGTGVDSQTKNAPRRNPRPPESPAYQDPAIKNRKPAKKSAKRQKPSAAPAPDAPKAPTAAPPSSPGNQLSFDFDQPRPAAPTAAPAAPPEVRPTAPSAAPAPAAPQVPDAPATPHVPAQPHVPGGAASDLVKAETKLLKAESKLAGRLARAAKSLKIAGRQASKAIPVLGIGAGAASMGYAASQGDTTGAALDAVGFVPVAGDLVDAGRAGIALGEAADELLGISEVAAEDGAAVESVARSVGLGETGSRIAGGIAAGTSAITVAPARALGRTVVDLWDSW